MSEKGAHCACALRHLTLFARASSWPRRRLFSESNRSQAEAEGDLRGEKLCPRVIWSSLLRVGGKKRGPQTWALLARLLLPPRYCMPLFPSSPPKKTLTDGALASTAIAVAGVTRGNPFARLQGISRRGGSSRGRTSSRAPPSSTSGRRKHPVTPLKSS